MYGILASQQNTGSDEELIAIFMAPLSIVSNSPGFAMDTVNLRRITSSLNTQRWEVEAAIQPTNDSAAFFVHNVVNKHTKKVYVRMPQIFLLNDSDISKRTPVGSKSKVKPVIVNVNDVTAGSVDIDFTGLAPYNLAVGEFVQFANHTKVYIIEEAGVNGIGAKIYPPLVTDVAAETSLKYGDNVTLHGYYDNNGAFGIKFSDGVMTDPGSWKILEAL